MEFLGKELAFPEVSKASKDGLLAFGGDLSPDRLILAYQNGIFPWYDENSPILWWSPDPRFVLFPEKLKVSKSMKQVLRNGNFRMTINLAFEEVISNCSKIKRDSQQGTWITNELKDAYINLYHLGVAKSVEVWQNKQLVGGLYGVDLNNGVFCGESMFSKVSNASKFGFISFIQKSNYKLIDCQVYTNHLDSLGAEEISREEFLRFLG
ncbi:leucyl/phenylalanyl-tRNA--protein transferase [Psychroserpens sp. XS_ASV72]|uniref:leucyl/phenylalanyl-tRNA--protein transferase n=1 Tax=Psychroserpens sp. XS_ASV72 TaxID=3241293 RepID=UPI003513D766